jgi:hypothetical protein
VQLLTALHSLLIIIRLGAIGCGAVGALGGGSTRVSRGTVHYQTSSENITINVTVDAYIPTSILYSASLSSLENPIMTENPKKSCCARSAPC